MPPQYIIANLGISTNFGDVDLKHLQFPVEMHIDWIRVYQPKGQKNIGCDPPEFPTQDYINTYVFLSPLRFADRVADGVLCPGTSRRTRTQI